MTEPNFGQRLWRWLERFGFTEDPFAVYEADQESTVLPYLFVDRPYVYRVIGNPAHAQAAFLFAGRGEGKTATREMVAYECSIGQLRRRTLAIRYFDFGRLLEEAGNDPGRITALGHVRAILRIALKALAEDVPVTYYDRLSVEDRALLASCACEFADGLTRARLSRRVSAEPMTFDWNSLSARELLEAAVSLITQLGPSSEQCYQSLYVLVDRVDETVAGPGAAALLLKSLAGEGPLLEMPRVGFKFFLPIAVGEQLRQMIPLRADRIVVETISWDEDTLREVVSQRLRHFSNDRVQQLGDLCAIDIRNSVMSKLLMACNRSPRTLLRICHAVILQRVSRWDGLDVLIRREDLNAALDRFSQQSEVESAGLPLSLRRDASLPAAAPPERGLYLDDKGHVWVDGQQVQPSLSDLEFQLLKSLYHHAPEIVSHEELLRAVWKGSERMDEQNLRKLVDRLRRRLEPQAGGRESRFIQNARGRGYWLKVT